jgi:hypothetical protein
MLQLIRTVGAASNHLLLKFKLPVDRQPIYCCGIRLHVFRCESIVPNKCIAILQSFDRRMLGKGSADT